MRYVQGSRIAKVALLLVFLLTPLTPQADAEDTIEKLQFLAYARETAQKERSFAWDAINGGFYTSLSRDWSTVINSDKKSLGNTFLARGFMYLYDATGESEYLDWAKETIDILLSRALDDAGGVFNRYDQSWNPTTGKKSLQVQADLLHVLVDLYDRTGDQTYQDHANQLAEFIVLTYPDDVYGGNFAVFDQDFNEITNDNKDTEISQGAFGWGMMRWYDSSGDTDVLTRVADTDDFTWENLHDSVHGGLMTRVSRDGSIIRNENKYPNVEMWGILGMLLYYRVTADATTRERIVDVLQHLRETMWDETYGGWFRSTFRDGEIRKETKDGWSQSEQPWFWSMAHDIMGIDSYKDVALMSGRWTRDNNYDTTDGGFYLELHRDGTIKLDEKSDWIQGGGIAAFALLGADFSFLVVPESPLGSVLLAVAAFGSFVMVAVIRSRSNNHR